MPKFLAILGVFGVILPAACPAVHHHHRELFPAHHYMPPKGRPRRVKRLVESGANLKRPATR